MGEILGGVIYKASLRKPEGDISSVFKFQNTYPKHFTERRSGT
ncbi:MAG: hypothetical protein ACWGQW_12840 [bacterium]